MDLWCVIFGIVLWCNPGYALGNNETLIVTSVISPPWMMLKPQTNEFLVLEGNARFEGYIVDLLEHLAANAQFDHVIRLRTDGVYGSLNHHDGSWTGMIREILDRKADIMASDKLVNALPIVSWTTPFQSVTHSLLVRKEIQSDTSSDGLVNPLAAFSLGSWTLLIGGLLLTCIILRLIVHYNPYDWIRLHEAGHDMKYEADSFQRSGTFWFICSSLLCQGPSVNPHSLGGRMIALVWFLFSIFVAMTFVAASIVQFGLYACSDVNTLTERDSFFDTSNHSSDNYTVGCTSEFLENADGTCNVAGNFCRINQCTVIVPSNQVGYQRIQADDKFALKTQTWSAKYFANKLPCNTRVVSVWRRTHNLALAVSLHAGKTLRDKLNLGILQLREDGTLEALQNKWLSIGRNECYATKQKKKMKHKAHMDYLDVPGITLGVPELSYIFYILFCGIILSGLAASFEMFAYPRIKHLF